MRGWAQADTTCYSFQQASASNHRLKVYNASTLRLTKALPPIHGGRITGLSFAHSSPHTLWSCSNDPALVMWDLRSGKAEQIYETDGAIPSCLAINCDDTIVGCGSDLIEEEDAPILLFDVRAAKYQHALTEQHSDDVTTIEFHPTIPTVCCTGSTDGLVNVLDLSQLPSEDDVGVQTLNTDSSVSKVVRLGAELCDASFTSQPIVRRLVFLEEMPILSLGSHTPSPS